MFLKIFLKALEKYFYILTAWVMDFLDWWKHELVHSLPPKLLGKSLRTDPKLLKIGMEKHAKHHKVIHLIAPSGDILHRTVHLPPLPFLRVKSAVQLNIERLSPLPLSEIYWAWDIKKRDHEKVLIDIFIARVSDINSAIKRTAKYNKKILGVSPEGHTNIRFNCNLVNRVRVSRLIPNFLQGAVILLFLFVGLSLLTWRLENLISNTEAEVATMKQASLGIAQSRRLLEGKKTTTDFIQEKLKTPDPISILTEITKTLPDTVWVQEMRINRRQVILIGEAENAAEAALALGNVAIFENVSLRSVVPGTEKERFDIQLELVK